MTGDVNDALKFPRWNVGDEITEIPSRPRLQHSTVPKVQPISNTNKGVSINHLTLVPAPSGHN